MASHEIPEIVATHREKIGSRYAARLREVGDMPCVLYGHGEEPSHLAVNAKEMSDILHRHGHLIQLKINDKLESALVKDVQWNHLGSHIIHVDLTRVDLSEEVDVDVEVELVGEPAALETPGAVLQQENNTVTVRCRADQIPEILTLDISDLTLDTTKTVADLQAPEGVAFVSDSEDVLASILIVQEAPEPEPSEDEELAEPEVIGADDEEGEGEGEGEESEE